ncbi:hypothetical protein GCM10025734_25950 [Kitasatospora paranensis]
MLAELLADLALDLVGAGDQLVEGAELVDPLRRGLLADAWDAGQVVGRVAAQGGEVRVLGGGDAVLLGDLLRGVAGELGDALGGVEDGDLLADQLEESRSPVTICTSKPSAAAAVARVAMMSSASKPSAVIRGMCMASSSSPISPIWLRNSSGVLARLAL